MTPEARTRFRIAVAHRDQPAGVVVDEWATEYLARHGIVVPREADDNDHRDNGTGTGAGTGTALTPEDADRC